MNIGSDELMVKCAEDCGKKFMEFEWKFRRLPEKRPIGGRSDFVEDAVTNLLGTRAFPHSMKK